MTLVVTEYAALRRIYVFKMSQDMFKTKLVFYQTLEI